MTITINGQSHEVKGEELQLLKVLEILGIDLPESGAAIARNWEVLPKGEWESVIVANGDELEIIVARQGG